jgi:hypothetical protein
MATVTVFSTEQIVCARTFTKPVLRSSRTALQWARTSIPPMHIVSLLLYTTRRLHFTLLMTVINSIQAKSRERRRLKRFVAIGYCHNITTIKQRRWLMSVSMTLSRRIKPRGWPREKWQW